MSKMHADCISQCMRAAFDVTYAILDNSTPPDPRKFHATYVDSSVSDLGKSGIYLRHGPEAQAVFATFACAFLLKVRASSCISMLYGIGLTLRIVITTSICVVRLQGEQSGDS